jgi:hypothetical protein
METIRSITPSLNGNAAGAAAPAPARVPALPPAQRVNPADAPAGARLAPAPLRQGLAAWDNQLQDEAARAQQALDYLDSLASQLESIKGDVAARLSGARGGAQLEARVRQLSSSLEARRTRGGGGIDARLSYSSTGPAAQRFRIRGLDLSALKAAGTRTLAFTVRGGPQVNVEIDPGLSGADIAQRFDRALAPLNVHAALDEQGQLVFSAPEGDWAGIQDSIVLVGAGRVTTEEVGGVLQPQSWETGNVDALRESLRDVVQALARVRQSQQAARAALSAAIARTATEAPPAAQVQEMAQDFASTASSPDYDSLIAITSALVGVSRERVLALLGLR